MEIGKYIDHTNLKMDAKEEDIVKLCHEAIEYGFETVCVQPYYVAFAKELLKDTNIGVCTVVGFPLGMNTPKVKSFEAIDAVENGADEVDNNKWLIKGRGGAMFKEKLNMVNSPITYILIDNSKKVNSLGKKHKIPVEIYPDSISYVTDEIIKLGAEEITLRQAKHKDGPVITENGNLILDVKFKNIEEDLEKNIKSISGVIESGLFINYNVKIVQ